MSFLSKIKWLLGIEEESLPKSDAVVSEIIKKNNGVLLRRPLGPVLMLDFDGVVHPYELGTFELLPLLESWLRQHTSVDIVISSNWKESQSFDELVQFFSKDIQPRVIGATPKLDRGYREDEILWVVNRYGIYPWAALDDRGQDFPKTKAQFLVETKYAYGVEEKHLRALENILGLGNNPQVQIKRF